MSSSTIRRWCVVALMVGWFAGVSCADTFYVRVTGNNSNRGTTPDAAWATITHAVDRASPGDVIYVGAGTHSASVRPSRDGTANQPIIVRADVSGAHTGDAGEVLVSGGGQLVWLKQSNHVHYEGLTFQVPGGQVVFVEDCAGLEFIGCTLKTSANGLIYVRGSSTSLALRGCALEQVSIQMSGGALALSGCTISDTSGDAISMESRVQAIIDRTRFDRVSKGINALNATVIVTNSVFHSADTGVRENGGSIELYHCTFRNCSVGIESVGGSTVVRNSIFERCAVAISRSGNPPFDHGPNLFYGNRADFRGVTDHPDDVSADPRFLDDSTEQIGDGSGAVDAAAPLAGLGLRASVLSLLTTDYRGGAREALSPDMGADEYVSGEVVATIPYERDFETPIGDEWTSTETHDDPDTTEFLGPFGGDGVDQPDAVELTLATTSGSRYFVRFDLLAFDTWDGIDADLGPDRFSLSIDGVTALPGAIANRDAARLAFPLLPEHWGSNIAFGTGDPDSIYRGIEIPFTATGPRTTLRFSSDVTSSEELWGIDNIAVLAVDPGPAVVPYHEDFEGALGAEWATDAREQHAALGTVLGRYDTERAELELDLTPQVQHTLRFDLLAGDGWAGQDFQILLNGVVIDSSSIDASSCQSIVGNKAPSSCGGSFLGGPGGDVLYRGCTVTFTPTRRDNTLEFRSSLTDGEGPTWAIDNVTLATGAWRDTLMPGLETIFYDISEDAHNTRNVDYTAPIAYRVFPSVAWPDRDLPFYPAGKATSFAVHAWGLVEIDRQGDWDFRMSSDDGSILTVDSTTLIEHDGQHGDSSRDGTITLDEGLHRIRIEYFQQQGNAALQLQWRGPGDAGFTPIPADAFYRDAPLFAQVYDDIGFGATTTRTYASASGIGFADFSGDGLPDAYISGTAPALLIATEDGAFTPTQTFQSDPNQFTIIDIDNDGDLDIWTAGERLLLNDGAGALTSVGSAGMPNPTGVVAVAAADVNQDGWIDPISFGAFSNWVGVNTGEDPPRLDPSSDPAIGFNNPKAVGDGNFASATDYSMDGTIDFLYTINGGVFFTSASPAVWNLTTYNLTIRSDADHPSGMDWGDYDNDGDEDIFVAEAEPGFTGMLWRNERDWEARRGRFADRPDDGIAITGITSRSCAWGDLDNDGDLDLVVTLENHTKPLAVFLNDAGVYFRDASFRVDIARVDRPQDIALCDVDLDGDLDIALTQQDGPAILLRNALNDGNGINVRVIGAGAGGTNAAAIGVRLELLDANGGFLASRTIGRARGMGVGELWAHFGGIDPDATYTLRAHFHAGPKDFEIVPSSAESTFPSGARRAVVTLREHDLQQRRVIRWQQVSPESGAVSLDSSDADR